jgi:hypothetical protein
VRIFALLAAGLLAAAAVDAAAGPESALARPALITGGETRSRGQVFFLRVEAGPGVAAVASAGLFDRDELTRAERVEFRALGSDAVLASAPGLLLPPGWSASAGASPEAPLLVFALDARPAGVTPLSLAKNVALRPGVRVRVLGLDAEGTRSEERYAAVSQVTPERFEIDLDRPTPLAAWAGAPVLSPADGSLLGTLEPGAASERHAGVLRASLLERALERPLEHGAGRPFASFAAPALPVAPAGAKLIAPSQPPTTRVALDVALPVDASAIPPNVCGIFVAGRARAQAGGLRGFDVAIVIDTSLSTIEPTGTDVNGNGQIGSPYLGPIDTLFGAAGDDPGDSILAAEVAAARTLLRELDPRNTRVALITFAGEMEPAPSLFWRPGGPTPPARTIEPLTRDFPRIERALDKIAATRPEGVTHMAAGVDQASQELLGSAGARSSPDAGREKVMLFLTDGQPTLPFGPGRDAENVRSVLAAADRAHQGGIRVHTFAIGPEALAGPVATVELAARTGGYFIPVREPGDLVDVVEAVRLPDLRDVVVRSATTGDLADPLHTANDGSFSGLLRAVPGENKIEVVARADDGTLARREIDVRVDPDAPPVVVPANLAVPRKDLLTECLEELRDARRALEREQAENVRRQLIVEIEREREKARLRAEEQRKELRLEVEREAAP